MMRVVPLLLGGLSLIVLGAGCASGTPEPASTEPYPGQSWALADGVVTAEEYGTAINRFLDCMRDAGYDATEPVTSPVDGVSLLFELTPSGDPDVYNRALTECDEEHKSEIERIYEESQDPVMDPQLREAVAVCLSNQGHELTGDERSAVDFIGATTGAAMPTMTCVNEGMDELFPDYPRSLSVRW